MFAWEDYEFELTGDTQGQIDDLRGALQQRRQPPVLVSYADVYDLSGYSGRVENIGEEKPYYSPCIANRNDDEGWFPQNLPVVVWQPDGESQPVAVPVRNTLREALKTKIEDARGAGRERIEFPGFPRRLPKPNASFRRSTLPRRRHSGGTSIRPSARTRSRDGAPDSAANQVFNDNAPSQADVNNVMLYEFADLLALLDEHTITLHQVERYLYADWQQSVLDPRCVLSVGQGRTGRAAGLGGDDAGRQDRLSSASAIR